MVCLKVFTGSENIKNIWQTFGIRTLPADIDDAVSVTHIFYLVSPLETSKGIKKCKIFDVSKTVSVHTNATFAAFVAASLSWCPRFGREWLR